MNYNRANIIITNREGESFQFEMENFSITDPLSITSRNGQFLKEGLNDPTELTGQAIYSYILHQFLKNLVDIDDFFTCTFQPETKGISKDKQTYAECTVQGSNFLESADKGAEHFLNIAFSLNKKVDDILIEV